MAKMDRLANLLLNRAHVSLWDTSGSGSDYSPENSTDLLELVKSFIENDDNLAVGKHEMENQDEKEDNIIESETESESHCNSCDSDTEYKLRNLFGSRESKNKNKVDSIETILVEAEQALKLLGARSCQGFNFKRQIMAHLRRKGFDAGLCKSKWGKEKTRSFPSGDYEYIDVNVDGKRYIVETNLAREFEIARPTSQYKSLLSIFPEIFVGNLEDLKQVVKLMCYAMKKSMKSKEMHVPPWRRNGYMLAKWFGSYRRTINEAPITTISGLPGAYYSDKSSITSCKAGTKVGFVIAAFTQNGLPI